MVQARRFIGNSTHPEELSLDQMNDLFLIVVPLLVYDICQHSTTVLFKHKPVIFECFRRPNQDLDSFDAIQVLRDLIIDGCDVASKPPRQQNLLVFLAIDHLTLSASNSKGFIILKDRPRTDDLHIATNSSTPISNSYQLNFDDRNLLSSPYLSKVFVSYLGYHDVLFLPCANPHLYNWVNKCLFQSESKIATIPRIQQSLNTRLAQLINENPVLNPGNVLKPATLTSKQLRTEYETGERPTKRRSKRRRKKK